MRKVSNRRNSAISAAMASMMGVIYKKSKFPVAGALRVTSALELGAEGNWPNKGKRSRRRRAARMRAAGFVHVAGEGWVQHE